MHVAARSRPICVMPARERCPARPWRAAANAGKVALLLRRYLDVLPQEPYLIVPNRSDVELVERQLLALQPALLAGSIGTFDDLFGRIAREGGETRRVATDAQRALV